MSSVTIPMPPVELRQLVTAPEAQYWDNPSGEPIFTRLGLTEDTYDTVLDFGCGCGRLARQLLMQKPRPRRYVGIDVHEGLIDWCKHNFSSVDPNFEFFHHDVYSPSYAPGNSLRLTEPFPVSDGEFSLFIASSVFTHLHSRQAKFYLREVARILKPGGFAFTSWFFFDRDSFPFVTGGPICLVTSETDPTEAVIYDRRWFLDTVRSVGLGVQSAGPPGVAGHQWEVILTKRTPATVDQFPLGEEGAEYLCGATLKRIATPTISPVEIERNQSPSTDSRTLEELDPAWFRALAEQGAVKQELEDLKLSWSWRIGRAVTGPARLVTRLLRR